MSQFNQLPTFPTSLINHGVTSKDWYFYWMGVFKGLPPANVEAVTPGVSPYTYTANVKGFVIIQGGTVSMVQFSRDGITLYDTAQTAGMFPLNAADQLTITYTVVPTVTFVPT